MKTLSRMHSQIHLWFLPVLLIYSRLPHSTLSCPHPCACYVNTEVHCTFRSLATVPTKIPKHVERINLGFNSIQSVPENAFSGLSKLEMLLIHSNEVQNIPNGAFRDLSSLQVFKMSYNKLKVINSHTFHGLFGLTRLHADHNKIEFIHPNAFNGLTALRLLHLEGNLLHQLHPNTFCTFIFLDYFRQSTLKHLYISDNMIQTLPAGMIQTMPLLENLYLHGNPWACDCQLKWLLEWDEQSNGVLKCKKDRSYENGQLCPMCSAPRHLQNQEIQGLKDMSCSRPFISSILRINSSDASEDDDDDQLSMEINKDFLGHIILNMTDEHGNKVNLECQIKKTEDFSKIQWNQLHLEEIDINATFALNLECPMTRDNYERLWKLIAYYSEVPVKLERELLFTDSSKLTYRYKQNLDHDSYYYTGVKAVISAEPEWVMQSVVKVQLNRRLSTAKKVTLSFTTQLSQSLHTKDIQHPKNSWVMINRNGRMKTSYSVIKGQVAQINCNVKYSENPTIEWSLPDGTILKAPYIDRNSRYSISPSGQLVIKTTDFADSGVYYCIAKVKHEVDTLPIRVVVQPPTNDISETNIKVVTKTVGEPLILTCDAHANPDAEVNWILPNNIIINLGTNKTSAYFLNNGSMLIPNTKITDSGLYRCIAVNQYGADSYSVQVAILKKLSEHLNKVTLIKKQGSAKPTYELIDDDRGSGEREVEEEKEKYYNVKDRVKTGKGSSAGRGKSKYGRKERKKTTVFKNTDQDKDSNIAEGRRKFESRKRLIGENKQIDPKKWASILAKVRGRNGLKTTEIPLLTTSAATTSSAISQAVTTPSSLHEPPSVSESESEIVEEASADEDELLFVTSAPKVTIRQYEDFTTLPDDTSSAVTKEETVDYSEFPLIEETEETLTEEPPDLQSTLATSNSVIPTLENIDTDDSIYSTGEDLRPFTEDDDLSNEITEQTNIHTTDEQENLFDESSTVETQTLITDYDTIIDSFENNVIKMLTTSSYDTPPYRRHKPSTIVMTTQVPLEEPFASNEIDDISHTPKPTLPDLHSNKDIYTSWEVEHGILPPATTAVTGNDERDSNTLDDIIITSTGFMPTSLTTTASYDDLVPVLSAPDTLSSVEDATEDKNTIHSISSNKKLTGIKSIYDSQRVFTTLSVSSVQRQAVTSDIAKVTTKTSQPVTYSNIQYPRRKNNGRRKFRPNRFRHRQNKFLPTVPFVHSDINSITQKSPIADLSTSSQPLDSTIYQNVQITQQPNILTSFKPAVLQTSGTSERSNIAQYTTPSVQTTQLSEILDLPLIPPVTREESEEISADIDSTSSVQEYVTISNQNEITKEDKLFDYLSTTQLYTLAPTPPSWPATDSVNTDDDDGDDNDELYIDIDDPQAMTTDVAQIYEPLEDLNNAQNNIPRLPSPTLPLHTTPISHYFINHFNNARNIPKQPPTTTIERTTQKMTSTAKKEEIFDRKVYISQGGEGTLSRPVHQHTTQSSAKYTTISPVTGNTLIATTRFHLTSPSIYLEPTQPSIPKSSSGHEAIKPFAPTKVTKSMQSITLSSKQNELDSHSSNKNKMFVQSKEENFKDTYTTKSNNSLVYNPKYQHNPRVVPNHHHAIAPPYYNPARATIRPPYIGTHGPLRYYITNQPLSVTNKPEITAYTAQSLVERKTYTPHVMTTTPTTTTTTVIPLYRPRPVTPNKYNQGQRITPHYRPFGNSFITDNKGTTIRFPYHVNPYYINPRNPHRFNRTRPFLFTATSKPNHPSFVAPDHVTPRTFTTTSSVTLRTTTVPAPATTRALVSTTSTTITTPYISQTRPYWHYFNVHQRPRLVTGEATSTRQPPVIPRLQESKPKIITTGFQSVSLPYEMDAVFPCETTGEPRPSITWTKVATGAVMSSNSRIQRFEVLANGTLHIQNLQLQDRGQYMCTAQNKHGFDKMTVTLAVVAQQPKLLSSRYKDILIYLGDTITMDCNATGIPSPHISWILPDRRILRTISTAESRIMLFANGSLIIKEVTFPDRGSYKCVASNVAGADSLTVKLQVSPLPPLIQQEKVENITLPQSHSIFIHCSAKGAPPPTIRWVLSDGTQVRPSQFANGNLFVFPNGTLYIRNSSPKDIGKYECIAANVVGAGRRIVYLDVKKYPLNAKITASSPQKTDVTYGGTLRLDCSAAGDPWPRIMWRLPSKRLVDSFFSFDSRIKTFANGTLIIYSVTEKDAGDYLCMARNKLGDDYVVLKVNVMMKAAKIQYKNDADHKVLFGGDLKVDCVATGVPNPEISWSLPDGSMVNNVMQSDDSGGRTRRYVVFNNGTLYFNEVGMKEEGDYTCYAINQMGQDEMRVSVKIVAEKPSIKNKTYSIINVPYGDVVTLSCEAKGEPVPKITWFSPANRPIPTSSDKYQIYQDGNLLIQKAQRSDSGNYTCLAQNSGGEDKKVVQIQVNVLPPKINGYSDKIITIKESAMKDTRLLIDCKAEGIPSPRVMWAFPEGVILPAPYYGNRITVHRNGTLDIKILRKTDSVQLVCIARNEGGEAKLIAQLTVTEPAVKPQFANDNENVLVAEGQVAKLNCSAVGIPQPDLIWILPNNTEIHSGNHLHRMFHKQDGTLHIGSVSLTDAGAYRCRAVNLAGSTDRLVTLQIGRKPQMSNNYNNLVSIINGETLQLHCSTQGAQRPLISWTLPNGIVIDGPQVKGRISLLPNGTLVVKDTSVYDRGSYQCKATTQYGSSTMNVPVIVIAYPPRITSSPAPVIYARPGSSIQLNCMSIGIPKAEIMWELPDKSHLTAGAQSRLYGNKFLHPQGTLVVQHSSKRDAGYYKCTAKNILGSDTKSTYIHVY
ncbi:matrix-remodeling-associated protein 5 [Hyperolius riggenbachi]|uniref:matrix-remodeling-associated protein 5 n=1 Tax=Hyperolius riggenbachi TaxID=752182 RepID=UPI0035A2BD54